MGNVWTLAAREFRAFLRSPLGYSLLAVYALVSGLILMTLLFLFREQILLSAQQAHLVRPAASGPSVQLSVVMPYFLNVASLLLFIIPFLTMRSFAEEKRQRSLEVLISYPLRTSELVFAKYLGVLAFALLLFAINGLHLVLLAVVSNPAAPPLFAGLGGLALMAMGLTAIGVFISTLAGGQVEAAVLTLGVLLLLAMLGGLLKPGGSWVQEVLANLSPLYQYQDFGRGLLAWPRVGFHLAVAAGFLALAIRGLDLIKWRG
ncbi:MAG: ABC transporter permease subunit [Candidatus Eisenbacteria bacterium]|nr:ABC transporter permease subunit [Candidatus Eisenbacteria bacterium]